MHERTLTFKVSVNDVVVMEIGYTQTHLLGIVADHGFFKWPKFTENNIQATTCKRESGWGTHSKLYQYNKTPGKVQSSYNSSITINV